jgi:GntR family transcriptional regulator
VPKYHQIYVVLREQLHEGRFAHGVPGEIALMREFGVARVTVRRALELLAAEGRIVRAPGRGTAPAAGSAARGRSPRGAGAAPARRHFTGLLENIVDMGLATSVKVVSCEVLAAPDAVADALALAPGSRVQKAVRVRSTREGPLAHITTWVPAALAAGFGRRELARRPILLLLEAAGVRIGEATQTISARLADATVAPRLGVAVGSALLAVSRLIHDTAGRPVQWLHGLYRPDRYEYRMQLSRVGAIDAKVWVSKDLPARLHPPHPPR